MPLSPDNGKRNQRFQMSGLEYFLGNAIARTLAISFSQGGETTEEFKATA